MTTHVVKALPAYFEGYTNGTKPWSLRKDDRGYQDGDLFHVQEEARGGGYTGREALFRIVKVWRHLTPHTKPGYVILTLERIDKGPQGGGGHV